MRPQLMDVFLHLASRPNQTVSKAELLQAVWPDSYIADCGVARCVCELRQLFGDSRSEPHVIRTVPKRGYRLVAPVEVIAPEGHAAGDLRGSHSVPGDCERAHAGVAALLRRATNNRRVAVPATLTLGVATVIAFLILVSSLLP